MRETEMPKDWEKCKKRERNARKEILKKEKKKCIFFLIFNFEKSQCHSKSCPDNWSYFVSFMLFLCHYSRCTNKESHFQKMVAKIETIHSIAWNIVYSIFSSINTKGYSIIYTWKFYLILSLQNNVEQQKPHCTELHIGLTSVSHWQVDACYFFWFSYFYCGNNINKEWFQLFEQLLESSATTHHFFFFTWLQNLFYVQKYANFTLYSANNIPLGC